MNKSLIKNIQEFRKWQSLVSKDIGDYGQKAVSEMSLPILYPTVLVWTFYEVRDYESPSFEIIEKLEYQYIYIENFPVREIRTDMFVYQYLNTADEWFDD